MNNNSVQHNKTSLLVFFRMLFLSEVSLEYDIKGRYWKKRKKCPVLPLSLSMLVFIVTIISIKYKFSTHSVISQSKNKTKKESDINKKSIHKRSSDGEQIVWKSVLCNILARPKEPS